MARNTWMTRAAGVLLPVSSLPSKYGIGNFGQAAREWVDFLVQAEQRYWQVLPWGPPALGTALSELFRLCGRAPVYRPGPAGRGGPFEKGRLQAGGVGGGPLSCGL